MAMETGPTEMDGGTDTGAAGKLTLSPYLVVRDAAAAIAFYRAAFGAAEVFRLTDPASGKIGHAELAIAGGIVMISDEYPDFGAVSADRLGGSPVRLHLDVTDAAATLASAEAAGATLLRALAVQFHGCKQAMVADPFGLNWIISQNVELVGHADMQRRWQAMIGG